MFPNVIVPEAHGLYAPGLGLLGSPRLASASLALPAPATTAAALRAARPPKAAGLLLQGAGKASEADAGRGKPSKPRPARQAKPGIRPEFGTFKKRVFVTDLEPRGSKWDFDGIAWQLFSRPITWRGRNPASHVENGPNKVGIWVGSGRAGFFGFFPEWSQMPLGLLFRALGCPGTTIWGSGGEVG